MTPADEETTIDDAFCRIRAAIGPSATVMIQRRGAPRPWSAWVVTHAGEQPDHRYGHVITVEHDRLGAALADLVRRCEEFAERLRGEMQPGQCTRNASAQQHHRAGQS